MRQDLNRSRFDRSIHIQPSDVNDPRADRIIVTRVPNQMSRERSLATSPHPDVYRQALSVILETPQIERRLNYITAGMIVTILGSWLTGSVVKSRPFTMFADILLFLGSAALAGLLVGIMLGVGFLPKSSVPVLLFVMVGLLILVLAVMLVGLLLGSTQVAQE